MLKLLSLTGTFYGSWMGQCWIRGPLLGAVRLGRGQAQVTGGKSKLNAFNRYYRYCNLHFCILKRFVHGDHGGLRPDWVDIDLRCSTMLLEQQYRDFKSNRD